MKKAMFLTAILSLGTLCWAGTAREDATDRLDNATDVVHAIMGAPDSGIPEEEFVQIDALAAVHPLAIRVYLCVGGHGTHDGRSTGLDVSSLLNDSLQSRTHISATLCH